MAPMGWLVEVVKAAVPFGGGIAVVLAIVAGVSAAAQRAISVRRTAVERAAPADIPKLIGDEIDKLGISAGKLAQSQQYSAVMLVLRQREVRNKRIFVFALVVTALAAAITVLGLVVAPERKIADVPKAATTTSESAATASSTIASAGGAAPCVGATVGNIDVDGHARVAVDGPCAKAGDIVGRGDSDTKVGSKGP